MSDEKKDQSKETNDSTVKPEPETLHTPDPQEEMKGPISSLMQGAKEAFENNNETKEEADDKKEKDM
jgi:hypothetical protein